MKAKIIACLFAFLPTFAVSVTAQSESDSKVIKAAYFESGRSIFPMGESAGATLLSHNNWFISSRLDWVDLDAPQLPDDYQKPVAVYSGPGADNSGNCLFCINVPNIHLGGSGGGGNQQIRKSTSGCSPFQRAGCTSWTVRNSACGQRPVWH